MRHPSTRAERRYAWSLARRRYRNKLNFFCYPSRRQPEENKYWNRGGKQCEAHGNRCAHSLIGRQERRRSVKAFRTGNNILDSPELRWRLDSQRW